MGAHFFGQGDAPRHDAIAEQALPSVEQNEDRKLFARRTLIAMRGQFLALGQSEPHEPVTRQREHVRRVADRREIRASHELDRHAPLVPSEVELDRLRRARQIGDAKDGIAAVLAKIGDDLAVGRTQEGERSAAERLLQLARGEHAPHPVQQGRGLARLRLDVDRLVAVDRVHDRRQVQPLRVGVGEPGVALGLPLHGRAYAVAIAEIDVVAHADLIAVIDERRSGHRQEQTVHQLDLVHVIVEQRCQAPAYAEVEPRARVGRVCLVHVVALLAGHHLQRELVVIAQEDGPLAGLRNVRRLRHDLGDGIAVFLRDGRVHARHQRKVICHMAFVGVAEVFAHVFGPLVGLGQKKLAGVVLVDQCADLLDDRVRLGKIFIVGSVALDEVRNRVQPETVDAHVQPEAHDLENGLEHPGIVEVEIRLVAEKAVPVELLRELVPGPVRLLGVGENDASPGVKARVIGPDVIVALVGSLGRAPRRLEPRMLVGGVVDDQLGDDAQAPAVRFADELAKVRPRPVRRRDVVIIGDVVAVVLHRRRIERQQPHRVDAQIANVVELFGEPCDVADAVVIGVEKRL